MEKSKIKQPGIAKSFFLGDLRRDLIENYPEGNKEERESLGLFLDSLKKFAKDKIDPVKIDQEEKVPEEVWEGLKNLGLFGLTISEAYGGFSFSQEAYGKVIEALTGHCASTAIMVGAHLSIGMKAIVLFGTEEQKNRFLTELASGRMIAAFALTEPDAGSDAGSIRSEARPVEGGKFYILNGTKHFITNAAIADLFTIFAKTEEKKITAFIVTKDLSGIKIDKEEKKLGIGGSVTNAFTMEDVKVPCENILGEKGKGFKIAMEVLNYGRLGLASGCLGAAKRLFEMSLDYAKQRQQFGRRLLEFEMIKEKLLEMAVEIFVIEAFTEFTARLADRGDIDFSLEAAICKVYAGESLWQIANHALQICGGSGYMREYPYERFLRDSRINMIFEGTNEILRVFIALEGMKLPGQQLAEFINSFKNPIGNFRQIILFLLKLLKKNLFCPNLKHIDPQLSPETKTFLKLARVFYKSVSFLLFKYGKRIQEKELMQERIANSCIYLYAISVGISKMNSLIKSNQTERFKQNIDLFKIFCKRAFNIIESELAAIRKNSDPILNKVIDRLG